MGADVHIVLRLDGIEGKLSGGNMWTRSCLSPASFYCSFCKDFNAKTADLKVGRSAHKLSLGGVRGGGRSFIAKTQHPSS